MRNAAGNAGTRQKKAAVVGMPKAVFVERDPELVRELYQLAIGQIGGFCPAAAKLPEEAEADALAYLDFPYEHHVRLRTSNVQERANRELRRRSRVAQAFPGRKSPIRMMGAVFSEMDEDWVARRWFNDDSIGRAVGAPKWTLPRTPTKARQPSIRQGSPPLSQPITRFPGGRWRSMSQNDGILGDLRLIRAAPGHHRKPSSTPIFATLPISRA